MATTAIAPSSYPQIFTQALKNHPRVLAVIAMTAIALPLAIHNAIRRFSFTIASPQMPLLSKVYYAFKERLSGLSSQDIGQILTLASQKSLDSSIFQFENRIYELKRDIISKVTLELSKNESHLDAIPYDNITDLAGLIKKETNLNSLQTVNIGCSDVKSLPTCATFICLLEFRINREKFKKFSDRDLCGYMRACLQKLALAKKGCVPSSDHLKSLLDAKFLRDFIS